MNTDVETNNQSVADQTDYYYKRWKHLREISRELFERSQKKVRLGHPITCDLARLLSVYEPINAEAYGRLQQRVKENNHIDAQRIYDWVSEEKNALKIEREMSEKAG